MNNTIVAVADLHGHLTLFDALLDKLGQRFGSDYTLVTLGDYVDNGPEVAALLDRLVALRDERGERFVPIMGNHDLACVLSMGWHGAPPSDAWCSRWSGGYWNYGKGTPRAYGVDTGQALAGAMPQAHRAFLQGLPWFHEQEGHVFVHAGLRAGAVAPQLEELSLRVPLRETYLHDQIRDKALATVSDPGWGKVVVSGHTHRPKGGRPHFVTDHRITLSSDADHTGELWAVALPERRFFKVARDGSVASGVDALQLA